MKFLGGIDWKLAAKNLLRNKRRSIVTGLAIAFGYVGLVLLSAYINRVQHGLEAAAVYANHRGHLALMKPESIDLYQAKPRRYIISADERARLEPFFQSHPEIDFTAGYLSGMGLVQQGAKSTPFFALGVEPAAYPRIFNNPFLRKWANDWIQNKYGATYDEFLKNPHAISITESLATLIGLHPPFTSLRGEQRDVQMIAKSFYNDLNAVSAELGPVHTTGIALAEDSSLIAPLPLVQELFATDGVEYLGIFLKDSGDLRSVRAALSDYLQEQDLRLELIPFNNEKWSPFYVGSMNFLYVMGAFFVILICGTVALSIVNSTAMGILERSREIGTLRAMGFEPFFIRRLFVKESLVLSLFSVFAGLAIGQLIASLVNAADIRFHPPGTQGAIQFLLLLDFRICLVTAIVLIVVNWLAAWFTTRGRLGKKVVQLLSDSGA